MKPSDTEISLSNSSTNESNHNRHLLCLCVTYFTLIKIATPVRLRQLTTIFTIQALTKSIRSAGIRLR